MPCLFAAPTCLIPDHRPEVRQSIPYLHYAVVQKPIEVVRVLVDGLRVVDRTDDPGLLGGHLQVLVNDVVIPRVVVALDGRTFTIHTLKA